MWYTGIGKASELGLILAFPEVDFEGTKRETVCRGTRQIALSF